MIASELTTDKTKVCRDCKQELPIELFAVFRRNSRKKDYIRTRCRPCFRKHQNSWYKADSVREMYRDQRLRNKYGITMHDYKKMLEGQGGKCAVCGINPGDNPYARLNVDHCHTTGKVRELLCGGCNGAMGLVKDNPDTLRKLADYLEKHGGYDESGQYLRFAG